MGDGVLVHHRPGHLGDRSGEAAASGAAPPGRAGGGNHRLPPPSRASAAPRSDRGVAAAGQHLRVDHERLGAWCEGPAGGVQASADAGGVPVPGAKGSPGVPSVPEDAASGGGPGVGDPDGVLGLRRDAVPGAAGGGEAGKPLITPGKRKDERPTGRHEVHSGVHDAAAAVNPSSIMMGPASDFALLNALYATCTVCFEPFQACNGPAGGAVQGVGRART